MASSQMSNSDARVMRRNASMSGSTSTKSNWKVRGLTVPSFSALLLPCVRVTVFSLRSAMASSDGFERFERHVELHALRHDAGPGVALTLLLRYRPPLRVAQPEPQQVALARRVGPVL